MLKSVWREPNWVTQTIHKQKNLKIWFSPQASEFGSSRANLNWRSTVFETNHLDWLTVKCQSLPKWVLRKSSTRFMATRGWGPFVEMKFNISTVDWFRGLLSVETLLRLETSTSTMPSLNERFRKSKANALNFFVCLKYFSLVSNSYHNSDWEMSVLLAF